MRKTLLTALVVGLLTIVMAVPALASNENGKSGDSNGRPGSPVQVTVLSSGLTYDSIAKASLPMKGRFQQLIPTAEGLTTQFGPGDHGYVGGRWWLDNAIPLPGEGEVGVMDAWDSYFICPLLGPGRPATS
jgi:hypothetical protein